MHTSSRNIGRAAGYLCLLAVALALLAAPRSQAAAQSSSGATLELQPATVQLAPGEVATFLLQLHNPTANPLRHLHLNPFTQIGALVQGEPPAEDILPPGGTLAWSGQITQTAAGEATGTIYFELSYDAVVSGADTPGAAVASLQVQPRPPLTMDSLAQLTIQAALNQLQEPRPGLLFLILKNTATVPLTVTSISALAPAFIGVAVPELGAGKVVPPQSSQAFPITITVSNTAVSGSQQLLFTTGLAWTEAGRPASGSLVIGQAVDVGILGESDLLKALGVPSFLFLPGFLILSTVVLLWTRVAPRQKATDFNPAEFSLISITLSLLAALVYPLLTGAAGTPRNYLLGYGLVDVLQVWFGAVLTGLFFWSVVVGGRGLRARWQQFQAVRAAQEQEEERKRRTLTDADDPLAALNKMDLNQVKFPLPQATRKNSTDHDRYFVIGEAGPDQTWLAPPIKLYRRSSASGPTPDGLEEAIDASPGVLYQFLIGPGKAVWQARWAADAELKKPTLLPTAQVDQLTNAQRRNFAEFA